MHRVYDRAGCGVPAECKSPPSECNPLGFIRLVNPDGRVALSGQVDRRVR